MKDRNLYTALFIFVTLLSQSYVLSANKDAVYVFKNGIAIFEAESAVGGSWAKETEIKGYTGKSYLHCKGGGTLLYKVKVDKPGFYAVAIRNTHFKGHLDNDCFIQVNKRAKMKVYSGDNSKQWAWWSTLDYNGQRRPVFFLLPGVNDIRLSGRSKGFRIDRIIVFETKSYTYKYQMPKNYSDSLPETKASSASAPEITVSKSNSYYLNNRRFGNLYKNISVLLKKEKTDRNRGAWEEAAKIKTFLDNYLKSSKRQLDSYVKSQQFQKALTLSTQLSNEFSGTKLRTEFNETSMKIKANKEYKQQLTGLAALKNFNKEVEKVLASVEHTASAESLGGKKLSSIKKEYFNLKKRHSKSKAFEQVENVVVKLAIKLD